MTDVSNIAKKDRRNNRSIIIGLMSLVPAIASVFNTLLYQSYLPPLLLVISVFVFPASVLCGFVSGLFSPKKAIVWAPVWACIAASLVMASLSGAIRDASITHSSWRFAWIFGGMIISGLAALATEYSAQNGRAVRILAIFILGCICLFVVQFMVIGQAKLEFEREVIPQIVSELDTNYIAVPDSATWHCKRKPTMDAYEVSAKVNGETLAVLVNDDDHSISGINYHHKGDGSAISTDKEAKNYLKKLGFQDKLLESFSRQKNLVRPWKAGIDNIRLTLFSNGAVSISTLPLTDK